MPNPASDSVSGEPNGRDSPSLDLLVTSLYAELHRMAAHFLYGERSGHTLEPTSLINELYLRLQGSQMSEWRGRTHFFAVAATTMRRILVDHARAYKAKRRGGNEVKVPIEFVQLGNACSYDDLLIVEEALGKLEKADPRAGRWQNSDSSEDYKKMRLRRNSELLR